jgi:hypothetical protein
MAKRKITVTVDENLVEAVQALGTEPLSAVVNAALASELDRRSRAATLGRILADWDTTFGAVPDDIERAAAAAFDDVDASSELPDPAPKSRAGRRGAA